MRAGGLRHLAVIESVVESRDATGAVIKTWEEFAVLRVEEVSRQGREFFSAQQVNAEISAIFRARYIPGVAPKMRMQVDGVVYDILGADPDNRRRELTIACKSRG